MKSRILLVIAHGSRSSAWNYAIETFCSNLQQVVQGKGQIDKVRWCYLEHAQPSIYRALQKYCQQPKQEIIALPLFLSVGQHVSTDIPEKVNGIASLRTREGGVALYTYQDCQIKLIDPPPTMNLLADNIERRIKRLNISMTDRGMLVVYYGAKRFLPQWNHLAFNVQSRLTETFPHTQVNWGYAGEAVDFSPIPLADLLKEMVRNSQSIVMIPALVAVGVVQNEIIPAAIELAGVGEQVIHTGDAMLPDTEMERYVLDYVQKFLSSP